jgi:hypothetical protein
VVEGFLYIEYFLVNHRKRKGKKGEGEEHEEGERGRKKEEEGEEGRESTHWQRINSCLVQGHLKKHRSFPQPD